MPYPKFPAFILFITLLSSCAKLPTDTHPEFTKLNTGPGPEDMVLDTFSVPEKARLLISCSSRRKNEDHHREIWTLDLNTEKSSILPRIGEPEKFIFNPHGIDIIKNADGSVTLFVVSHMDELKKQAIVEYRVYENYLEWQNIYTHNLLTSPNDVCAIPGGGFYWSNDGAKRNSALREALWGIKGGYIGLKNSTQEWHKSKTRFGYPNGVIIWNNNLIISTVIQSKIFQFSEAEIQSKPILITKVKGGDNFSQTPKNNLLVTAHLRQFKFIRHALNSKHKSPTVVYWINPKTKENRVVYADSGKSISAASTAIYFKGNLYICQIFDPFIIKVTTELTE